MERVMGPQEEKMRRFQFVSALMVFIPSGLTALLAPDLRTRLLWGLLALLFVPILHSLFMGRRPPY